MTKHLKRAKKQIAAIPIALAADGELRILVITSRETRRFLVPKGWPMKGVKDHRAAEVEAREEAGLVGRAQPKAIGSYSAWKRDEHGFKAVRVKVFLFDVEGQLDDWKEKGQREMAWLRVKEAALLIDEPGLADLVLKLPHRLLNDRQSRVKAVPILEPRSDLTQPASAS